MYDTKYMEALKIIGQEYAAEEEAFVLAKRQVNEAKGSDERFGYMADALSHSACSVCLLSLYKRLLEEVH